jgi:(2R)-3-sulfolactate dehydrogenase (NADP+)
MMVTLNAATAFATAALERAGANPADARRFAHALVAEDRLGYQGFGLARLPGYVARVRAGGISKSPWRLAMAGAPVEHYDGCAGFGHLHLEDAARRSSELAMEHGIGVVGISNSNHAGAIGIPARWIAEQGIVSLITTNAPAMVAPPGGTRRVVGTNPLAVAIPIPQRPPMVCDLSSSQVNRNEVLLALQAGTTIPLGWATDKDGRATTDPREALDGALAPLGGVKGFALALAVEALTGILLGPAIGPEITDFFSGDPSRPQGIAHLVLALDPRCFGDPSSFGARAERLRDAVEHAGDQSTTRLPGARAALAAIQHDRLCITPGVQQALREFAVEIGIEELANE